MDHLLQHLLAWPPGVGVCCACPLGLAVWYFEGYGGRPPPQPPRMLQGGDRSAGTIQPSPSLPGDLDARLIGLAHWLPLCPPGFLFRSVAEAHSQNLPQTCIPLKTWLPRPPFGFLRLLLKSPQWPPHWRTRPPQGRSFPLSLSLCPAAGRTHALSPGRAVSLRSRQGRRRAGRQAARREQAPDRRERAPGPWTARRGSGPRAAAAAAQAQCRRRGRGARRKWGATSPVDFRAGPPRQATARLVLTGLSY